MAVTVPVGQHALKRDRNRRFVTGFALVAEKIVRGEGCARDLRISICVR
jgi:hypothetical protein